MRDVKVVAYGSVTEDDERLIETYLSETRGMDRVNILTVNTPLEAAQKENAVLRARIAELEE